MTITQLIGWVLLDAGILIVLVALALSDREIEVTE